MHKSAVIMARSGVNSLGGMRPWLRRESHGLDLYEATCGLNFLFVASNSVWMPVKLKIYPVRLKLLNYNGEHLFWRGHALVGYSLTFKKLFGLLNSIMTLVSLLFQVIKVLCPYGYHHMVSRHLKTVYLFSLHLHLDWKFSYFYNQSKMIIIRQLVN